MKRFNFLNLLKISLSFFGVIVLSLFLLFPACKKDSNNNVTPNYTQIRTDVETILEFNAQKQCAMLTVARTLSNDYKKKIADGDLTYQEMDAAYSKLYALQQSKAVVEKASKNLEDSFESGFRSNILESRGTASRLDEYLKWLASSAENSRKRILYVSENFNQNQRLEMYNSLKSEWKSKVSSEADFWNQLGQGKLDFVAPQIYNDLYNNTSSEFNKAAALKKLTPDKIFIKEMAEGLSKGTEVMVQSPKLAALKLAQSCGFAQSSTEYSDKIKVLYGNDAQKVIANDVKQVLIDKLSGFNDYNGPVDVTKISNEAGDAMKIMTDFTIGSEDPGNWVKNTTDLGLGKVLDSNNETGKKSDVVIAVKSDKNLNPKGPKIIISFDPVEDDTDKEDVVDIFMPSGEWVINSVNKSGNNDKVITEIIDNVSSIIPVSTDPNSSHTGGQYSLSVWITPADPGPSEGVTVIAKISPAKSGEDINFKVLGSDGYTKEAITPTDIDGKASFSIPGGAAGVSDEVTIKIVSSGVTRTLNYSF